jgi:mRNA-degrading endonuclease RelE of RelBE toxin-antitoxin system
VAEIRLSPQASEHYDDLDPSVREQVISRLERAGDDLERYVEALSAEKYDKIRAGDYRALVRWDRDSDEIGVYVIGHRSVVYDRYL